MNRQSSFSKKSSLIRLSLVERERDGESQIPRPRIRTSSSDRSSLRPPSKICKSVGNYRQSVTLLNSATPQSYNQIHSDLPLGPRSKSPSAERISSLCSKSKKDTRPLNDKNYQTLMLNRIDNFFQAVNQTCKLNSNGSLKPITLNMFISVTEVLLQCLGLKYGLSTNNYIDKLPIIAKKLHYPGIVNKSWLKTANAPHSWPQVLAWICWLVEICEVDSLSEEKIQLHTLPFINSKNDKVIERNKLIIMFDCYEAWNNADSKLEQELIDKYLRQVSENSGFTDEDNKKAQIELDESNEKLKSINNEMQQLLNAYNNLLEQKNNYQSNIDKYNSDKVKREDYLNELQNQINKLEVKNEQFDVKKNEILNENNELMISIEKQSMNVEQRNKIIEKCSDLKRFMSQFDDHLDELKNESWSLDLTLSNINENLRKLILNFNKNLIINIKDSDELKLPENSMADVKILERIKEKDEIFNKFYNDMKQQLHKYKLSIENKVTQLDHLKEKKQTIVQEQSELELKYNEKKLFIKNLKLQTKNEEQRLKNQVKKLEEDIKQMEMELSSQQKELTELESTIMERNDKYDALQRRKSFLEQSSEQFFDKFYDLIAKHRQQYADIICQF